MIVERAKLYSLNLSKITENAIFSIIDFLDTQRSKSRLKAILTFPLSLSMLFTHGGAWGITIGILVVYLLLTILKRQARTNSFEIRLLIAIISINIVAGILRNYALGWSAGGFETLRQAQVALKPTSLASFRDDTLFTFLHTMYGFFINPLAILLVFIGALIIVHDDSPLNRYLTSWLISSSIFFVLTPSWEIKSRILFNIPLPIFEAIGLIGLTSLIQKHLKSDKTPLINRLTASLVLLITLNYAFRCAFAMSQVIYDLFPKQLTILRTIAFQSCTPSRISPHNTISVLYSLLKRHASLIQTPNKMQNRLV